MTTAALAAVALAAAALAAVAAGMLAAPALAGWSAPSPVDPPMALDIAPAQIDFSAGGAAAISFGVQDEDDPADSVAQVVERGAGGGLSGRYAVPSAQAALALAFDGPTLELLTGASPTASTCCDLAAVLPLSAGGTFERPRTLVGGLAGAALGRLVPLPPIRGAIR